MKNLFQITSSLMLLLFAPFMLVGQSSAEITSTRGSLLMALDVNEQSFKTTTMPKIVKLNNATINGPTDDGYNLTFVSSTGVAWLDATISKDHTTPQIRARMIDPNDDLYGFRYATDDEVAALMKSYGLPGSGEVPGDGPALLFMKDFGDLGSGYRTMKGQSISMIWAVEGDPNQYKQIIAQTKNNKSSVAQGGIDPNSKESHFIVFGSPMIPHNDASLGKSPSSANNMTFDCRTGLNWLDVAMTNNNSIQDIEKRIKDRNDELYGFQYAIYDDVEKMLTGYGVTLNGGEMSGTSPALAFIMDFDFLDPWKKTMVGPSSGGIFYARPDLGQILQVVAHTEDESGKKNSSSTSGYAPDNKNEHTGNLIFKPISN